MVTLCTTNIFKSYSNTDFDISLTKSDARMLISLIEGEIGSCFKIKIGK